MEDGVRRVDMVQIRLKACKLCRNYLTGVWKTIEPEDLILEEICGGLSNLIFYCGLPKSIKPRNCEPAEVLLRIFGNTLTQLDSETPESFITSLVMENVIFTILSERKLGPKLMGVFAGGRLEEYIPAKSLTSGQLRKKNFSAAIARKIGQIHRLAVPINTDPRWIFKSLEKWQEMVSTISLDDIRDVRERSCAARLLAIDFSAEIEWLKKLVAHVNSPVVFCHNDLQGGNILLRRDMGGSDNDVTMDNKLVVIDYEFCSYNYRGFDIANHLTEWIYDYNNKEYPYYYIAKDKFPSRETQMEFLHTYLEEYHHGNQVSLSYGSSPQTGPNKAIKQQTENLYKEVQSFMMGPNLVWALWSMAQSLTTKITFGHWHHAEDRMQYYFRYKEAFLYELDNEVAL